MVKVLWTLLLLAAMVAAISWSDRPLPRADFTIINRGDVATMDLSIMSWRNDFRVARLVYEGLTVHDVFSEGYTPLPGVAERWDVSPDGRTYTFHLRPEARWSNGDPVRASDFVYSWRRSMLPDLGGDYAQQFTLIRGVASFQRWRLDALREFAASPRDATRPERAQELWNQTLERFDQTVALRTPDDRTLIVELVRPTAYFLDLTGFPVFSPLYPPAVEAARSIDRETGMVRYDPGWTKPPRLVTNGAFVLSVWRFKRDMRFEKNPYYWNKGAIAIDSINAPSVADPNAEVMAFETGAVDWVSDVTVPYRPEIIARRDAFYREHAPEVGAMRAEGLDDVEIDRRLPPDPRKNIHVFPSFGCYFYNFNCMERLRDGRANPFADPRVRRAFAMAVDKETIARDIRRSGEHAIDCFIPPGTIGAYRSPEGLHHDPEMARTLLAQAGYPGGKGLPTIEILFNKDGGHELIAQNVAKGWERELGVSVRLEMKETKTFREDLKNANYMVSRASWFGDYGDPTTFLDINRAANGNNDRKYHSEKFERLMGLADEEPDPRQRLDLLAQAEQVLVEEDLPLLPLFQYSEIYLFDSHRFTGISPHPRQEQDLSLIDVYGDGKGTDQPRTMHHGRGGSR